MQKKYLGLVPLLVLVIGLGVMPVQATNNATPLKAKHTFTGATLTAFDSDYHAKDFLIVSGNQIDLDKVVEGLVIPDDDVSVDLSETSLISDSAIDSDSDFSPTFINNTFNVGVESSAPDSLIDAELSGSYADTQMNAEVTFNTSGVETVTWSSVLATDENGDGDYEDSADRGYRTSIGGSGQILYWNAMADWNVSDADNYMKLTWSFKTTGSSDYDFEIIHYTGSGVSGWSNVDSSGENKITLSLYDTDEEHIALMAGINELLQMDLGDNPVISGLNELIVEVGTNNAGAEVDVRINNFCVFSDYPAITDKTDNDDDWDLDAGGVDIMTGLWDDNDFLVTQITGGATEAYDSTVPLRNKIETSPYAMLQDAKIITFVGNMYYLPSEWSVSSSSATVGYTTTELWTFDTTIMDDLQTPSDVLSWTDTYYNMTLSESILVSDYEDFEDDLTAFEFEGTDKVEDLRTLWDSANEDDYKVAYDGTNPDSSTGSSYDFSITYQTDLAYSEEGGVAVTPAGDNTLLIIGIGIVAIVGLAGLYAFVQWRQQPKRRKKKK
jgi:hypothetical protein